MGDHAVSLDNINTNTNIDVSRGASRMTYLVVRAEYLISWCEQNVLPRGASRMSYLVVRAE